MSKNKEYTHVSLFSGVGGLDIGLEQAGFHTVWANDFNHDACETHRLWSNATVIEGNIGKVDYDTIPDCDIASFGFPCQGFSLSGPRKIDDSRNVLYRHCVKLVEKKQPKLFLAENVKGLLTLGGGKIKDAIIADFESKGYVVSINLVNAADYHVPEDRQRILLVGIRKDFAEKYGVEFKVPAPFADRISIRQALEGLAPATDDEICKEAYSSRYMSRNRKRGWDSVSFTIPAMAKQVPLWPGSPDMVKVGKDLWKFGEEGSTRRLSYREAAAIQTFPKDIVFCGNLTSKYKQIGNAVPCELARVVGTELYRKAQAGQVFTPDHIASFMYRLIDVNMNDRVLDATCGSGTFLVKSMCNMIREAGGSNTSKAKQIKSEQLFGIEMYRKVYALACANMMIHKDGKTNLVQMDATSAEATEWIRKQKITKVLMNPPYERRYGCATIVANVLDSVPAGTKCAFILPDKKMEKESKLKALLERHTLTTIIKLPENLFFGLGVTTSIFIFETGKPQNGRSIKGYYVADDGLETVKNKGRQDVHDKWPALEDYWVKAIQDDNDDRYNTRQLINPAEHLSYQMPEKPFELYEEDFIKTVMDYEMYKRGINAKEFGDKLLQKVLYGSTVTGTEEGTNILVEKGEDNNGED